MTTKTVPTLSELFLSGGVASARERYMAQLTPLYGLLCAVVAREEAFKQAGKLVEDVQHASTEKVLAWAAVRAEIARIKAIDNFKLNCSRIALENAFSSEFTLG